MNKKGFVLVELLLATVIAGIISIALFSAFYQVNLFVNVADDFIDIYSKATLVHHQLEKDLVGTSIPVEASAQPKEKKDEKKEQKPFKKLFFGSQRDDHFDELTFITNNPLHIFWSKQAGAAKPYIARVLYRLVEDDNMKGSYALLRQESYQLDIDAFKEGVSKSIRAYTLVDGIKNCSITYGVLPKKEDKKDEKKEIASFNEWDAEKMKESDVKKVIPDFVKIAVSLWDEQQKQSKEFSFVVPIRTDFDEEHGEKKQQENKKNETMVAR